MRRALMIFVDVLENVHFSILLIDPALILILSQGSVDNVLNEKWLMNVKCGSCMNSAL